MTKSQQSTDESAVHRDDSRPHVVVIGGGFGGLRAARDLAKAPVRVTLIDRRNFHLFQPLLYQVATGGLSPAHIAAPLRNVFKRQRNLRVLLGEVTDVDPDAQRVLLEDGHVHYDYLVIAAGARFHYFGNDEWVTRAPGLKSVEDALEIRRRVYGAFEAAERTDDPDEIRRLLTFVIVGAGPTGVELAGALTEIARHTLRHEFRAIDPSQTRVILLDAAPHVLDSYPRDLRDKAAESLRELGVDVRTGLMVTDVREDGVTVKAADGTERPIQAQSVLWAAGVRAAGIAEALAARGAAECGKGGFLTTTRRLHLPKHPNVYVVGDLAAPPDDGGEAWPGVAPRAIQQGAYAARAIAKTVAGETHDIEPFAYHDKGSMATIGRSKAVADLGRLHFSGFPAWLLWLAVHLFSLVLTRDRVFVALQWAYNYATWNRGARLITDQPVMRPVAAEQAAADEQEHAA